MIIVKGKKEPERDSGDAILFFYAFNLAAFPTVTSQTMAMATMAGSLSSNLHLV